MYGQPGRRRRSTEVNDSGTETAQCGLGLLMHALVRMTQHEQVNLSHMPTINTCIGSPVVSQDEAVCLYCESENFKTSMAKQTGYSRSLQPGSTL